MGSICSSAQSNKDHDSISNSESSPCYRGRHQGRKQSDGRGPPPNQRNGGIITDEDSSNSVHHGKNRPDESFASAESEPVGGSNQLTNQDNEEPIVPCALLRVPDCVKSWLAGQINPSNRPLERGSTIALYIASANPRETARERQILRDEVVPILSQHAAKRGFVVHLVDLRCDTDSVTADATLSQNCLSELARQLESAHVIPILIFTEDLGKPILPQSIEAQDFLAALAQLSKHEEDRQLLEQSYAIDDHAQPPCYRLRCQPGASEAVWSSTQLHLLNVLISVFPNELRDTYLTTLLEQEVHNSVCMSQELANRCIWVQRPKVNEYSLDSVSSAEQKRRAKALHSELKSLLKESNIYSRDEETDASFAEDLAAIITPIMNGIIDEAEIRDPLRNVNCIPRRILEEISQHISFGQKAVLSSINRETSLESIKRYIMASDPYPMVVYGPRGSGKTTLMARTAQFCSSWLPKACVLLRFVGLTPDSVSTACLLQSISTQCSLYLTGRVPQVSHNVASYQAVLSQLLTEVNHNTTVVILVDGLDQLSDESTENLWTWVPQQLANNLRLVVTVSESSPHMSALQTHLPYYHAYYQLESLEKAETQSLMLSCMVQQSHVAVPESLLASSIITECRLPLTVKLFTWRAMQRSSWSNYGTEASNMADAETLGLDALHAPSPPSLLQAVLNDLETQLGENITRRTLMLFGATRFGVADNEMTDILRKADLDTPPCRQLLNCLAPFIRRKLVGGVSLSSWNDISMRESVQARYGTNDLKTWSHSLWLEYYQNQLNSLKQNMTEFYKAVEELHPSIRLYRRMFDEIPHHIMQLGQDPESLFQVEWIFAKAISCGFHQVLEDLTALANYNAEFKECAEVLVQKLAPATFALTFDARQICVQLVEKLGAEVDESLQAQTQQTLRNLYEAALKPPISSFIPRCEVSAGQSVGQVFCDEIYRVPGNDSVVLVLSTSNSEVSVREWGQARPIRTLTGLNQPVRLLPMTENRCLILCGRKLELYNLDTGAELLKLKGIMNQKLPLFGPHDDHHVVTLARNRMYVNLINVENGDCVTTFKVGEDRFLNSLLVSQNGRILVCGDETRKPCSLLVWDLGARKLLYDLRMPHHEFQTSLSTITKDGNYVCCGCKEMDSSDPNFIVVYDLQNGTLFRKWKTGINTVALAMACQYTCVVCSLEDSTIVVWNLVTGNRRCSLTGHTSPADVLCLDGSGRFLLSRNSKCVDPTIRLSDLETGQCVASYTPDWPITACQISENGSSIMLALKGCEDLLTFQFAGEKFPEEICYGAPENLGVVFDVSNRHAATEPST